MRAAPRRVTPLLLLAAPLLVGLVPSMRALRGDPAITRVELERHVRVLASDAFEGRETGTPGGRRAATYLAGVLKDLGIRPAGDGDGYLQDVGLVRLVRDTPPLLEARPDGEGAPLVWGVDFDLRPDTFQTRTSWLSVVRVTEAAEMPAKPDPNVALFLDGSRRRRDEWLARSQVALEGEGPDSVGPAAGDWGLLLYPGSSRPGRRRDPVRGRLRPAPGPEVPWVVPRGELRERLRSGEITSLRLAPRLVLEPSGAANVVGILPGVGTEERPELAREAVVLSAHYDHLGLASEASGHTSPGAAGGQQGGSGEDRGGGPTPARDQEVEGDRIFNGADDDASGTAAVLELAGALAAGEPPARTVVFLLATGEEKGLLGTKFYLDHPVVPLSDTIFNLNFEMIGRPDALAGGPGNLWLTGHDRTTLFEEARASGVELKGDMRPEEHFFERSDNYAFVLRGVAGQTLSSYNMHRDYHRVSDEADLLDYEHMETCVERSLPLVRLLLSGELSPRWIDGEGPRPRGR